MHLINNHVGFQHDCGATANILPVNAYKQIANNPAHWQAKHNMTKTLLVFSKTTLKTLGTVTFKTVNPRNDEALTLDFLLLWEKAIWPYEVHKQFNSSSSPLLTQTTQYRLIALLYTMTS